MDITFLKNGSVVVTTRNTSFLIDCGKGFLEESSKIDTIDFVLLTSAAESSIGGLGELYEWMKSRDIEEIQTFMERESAQKLRALSLPLSHLSIKYFNLSTHFTVNTIPFMPFKAKEGAVGYKFFDMLFAPVGEILPESAKFYENIDTIIVNGEESKKLAESIKANHIISSEMSDKHSVPERISQTLFENREGIKLVAPSAEMIYSGEKQLIIHSRLCKNRISKLLYLLDDTLCYGLIRLKTPVKVNVNEFKTLAEKHNITEDERNKWWPHKEILYAYDFEVVKKFEYPEAVGGFTIESSDIFIDDFEFLEDVELIKDIKSYDPIKISLPVLKDDWRIVTAWYSTKKRGSEMKHSLEDIIHLGRIIYEEMKKRGIEFHPETMKPYAKELYELVSNQKTELAESDNGIDLSDPNLLEAFGNKIIIKDFISVCGSTVSPYQGQKPHDIDLNVKMTSPNDYIKRAVEVRILKELAFSDKIHFIWGDPEGPHDSFIPLYDLVLERIKPLKVVRMNEEIIEFSELFKPMKPSKRFYDIDEATDYMFKTGSKYGIEKKYNGIRAVAEKIGNRISLHTEQKEDITSKFPILVEELNKISTRPFLIDTELTYKNGGRTEIIRHITKKEELDDSKFELNVFDILSYSGEDLTDKPWTDRKSVLHSLNYTPRIKEAYSIIVDNKEEAKKAINLFRNMKESEGAMIKRYDGKYKKNAESDDWIKFRNEDELSVKVIKPVKTSGGSVYRFGIEIPESDRGKFNEEYMEEGVLDLGKTFVTKEEFNSGDNILVNIEEVWRHVYPDKTIRYSVHKPKVMSKSDKPLSSWQTLDNLAVSKGEEIIENAEGPTTSGDTSEVEGKIWKKKIIEAPKKLQADEGGAREDVNNFPDRMQRAFKENPDGGKFVMQWHLRGNESIHTDLRLQTGDHLEGFTLFTPGSTGGEDKLDSNPSNIRGTIKLPQPSEWLAAEGGYPSGEPGTTSKHNAYFAIVGKGTYKPLEVEDHKIVFEMKTDSGEVSKIKPLDDSDKETIDAFNTKLPSNLKQLDGKYSYHIAHIGDRHIVLFDKVAG